LLAFIGLSVDFAAQGLVQRAAQDENGLHQPAVFLRKRHLKSYCVEGQKTSGPVQFKNLCSTKNQHPIRVLFVAFVRMKLDAGQ
jgi:hypothetical protein